MNSKEYLFRTVNGEYKRLSTMFDGVKVLKSDGFFSVGASKNVYTASWMSSENEDFGVTDEEGILREPPKIELTFIVAQKYANTAINVEKVYADMQEWMLNGMLFIRHEYSEKEILAVNIDGDSTNKVKLRRNEADLIMATWAFHAVTPPYKEQSDKWFILDVSRLNVNILK